jgi:hypothetical protein
VILLAVPASNALQALASTGVVDPAFINRLQGNEFAAAACQVNLHKLSRWKQSRRKAINRWPALILCCSGSTKTRIVRVRPSRPPPRIGLHPTKIRQAGQRMQGFINADVKSGDRALACPRVPGTAIRKAVQVAPSPANRAFWKAWDKPCAKLSRRHITGGGPHDSRFRGGRRPAHGASDLSFCARQYRRD